MVDLLVLRGLGQIWFGFYLYVIYDAVEAKNTNMFGWQVCHTKFRGFLHAVNLIVISGNVRKLRQNAREVYHSNNVISMYNSGLCLGNIQYIINIFCWTTTGFTIGPSITSCSRQYTTNLCYKPNFNERFIISLISRGKWSFFWRKSMYTIIN